MIEAALQILLGAGVIAGLLLILKGVDMAAAALAAEFGAITQKTMTKCGCGD